MTVTNLYPNWNNNIGDSTNINCTQHQICLARYNMLSMRTTKTNTHTSTVFYFMSLRKLVLFFSNQDWNITYSKWHCHHKCYVEYSTCKYKAKLYCVNQNTFAKSVIKITVAWLQNILKIIIILFMSTIQTRNKMDDKRHQNQFYFVANAQLFDSSERQNRINYRQCQTRLST